MATELRVGCRLSIVIELESSVSVTATPALPFSSSKAMENVIAPLASLSSTNRAQVQPVASPVAVDGEFSIASLAESVKVQVGAVVTSVLEVKVKDSVSPSLPSPVPPLLMATVLRVGAVPS